VSRAVVLVRNDVSYDTRVLRSARVLSDLGLDPLIVGVATAERPLRSEVVDETPIVRLPLTVRPRWLPRANHGGTQEESARTTDRSTRVSWRTRLMPRIRGLAYYVRATQVVLARRPILVHANDHDTAWVGVLAKLLCRSRFVYDTHELWPDRNGRWEWRPWLLASEALFVRLADATVTVSPGVADVIARRYRVKRPVVIRNVPDHVLPSASQDRERRAAQPVAVYVGAVARGRGLEQAVEVLVAVPELRLRLIGPSAPGYETQLALRAQTAGVADRVEFEPPVEPSTLGEAIADADMGLVLIQPICLSYELSLPNKLFEYVAAGLPVVASDLPVLGPLVRDEEIGEVVPPGDIDALAQAVRRLADPARNAEVRERVRSFGEHTTWARERRLLESVYTSLIDLARPGHP
jgi:glycosyltransferase involved in cell wall biosynthesis